MLLCGKIKLYKSTNSSQGVKTPKGEMLKLGTLFYNSNEKKNSSGRETWKWATVKYEEKWEPTTHMLLIKYTRKWYKVPLHTVPVN